MHEVYLKNELCFINGAGAGMAPKLLVFASYSGTYSGFTTALGLLTATGASTKKKIEVASDCRIEINLPKKGCIKVTIFLPAPLDLS